MSICCCSLPLTNPRACETCRNRTNEINTIRSTPLVDTYYINTKPIEFSYKSINAYSIEELLLELNSRTNVFVSEIRADDKEKMMLVVIKK